MPRSRQHLKADRHTTWGTYQVQPPPIELPLLGSAPSKVSTGAVGIDLAAPECPHSLAYGHGQAINDEGFSHSKHFSKHLHNVLQQGSQGMQSPAEAGSAQWFGDVAH